MEFSYQIDNQDCPIGQILADLLVRSFQSRLLDYGLSNGSDPSSTLLLTTNPSQYLANPASILIAGQYDQKFDNALAAFPERVIAISKSAHARLAMLGASGIPLAELPSGQTRLGQSGTGTNSFEIILCSEFQGMQRIVLNPGIAKQFPALGMFLQSDLPCPVRLHLGDKPFADLSGRAAASIASGALTADLSFDVRSDFGDLTPFEVSSPIFGDKMTLENLGALYECLSDKIYTDILLRRQQDLLPAFNAERERALVALLRDKTPLLIEALYRAA